MKIVVFSDAHGDKLAVLSIIRNNLTADMLISLGDSELPNSFLQENDIIAIKGNYPLDAGFVYEKLITVGKKRIFLTHGHKYNVRRGVDKLYYKALETEADIVLYGHTHIPKTDKVNNILIINPGSIYKPRNFDNPTYLRIEIENGVINYKYIDLASHNVASKQY
ncbi:hypothetical protein CI105_08840 [Candidatus Izimaplasma bacterium ZiA1]|uniref:metallophosphoesterase family protein n=1 Tax=Candidatus Izimoplasma sp. ZiA1 TaxID=2024899 RepID=UPI000BAA8DDF|nr:hypothetical protein CI105_08840 [Candidatus Izimaplasma bacterium ZiA1]